MRSSPYIYWRIGMMTSVGLHVLIVIVLLVRPPEARRLSEPATVYSVSIEGGKRLGGIAQVSKSNVKTPIAPPKNTKEPSPPKQREEPKKIAVPQPKRADPPPKPAPDVVPIAATKATPRPTPPPAKQPPAKPAPPKATPPPRPKEPTIEEINKELQRAVQRYQGESSDAGGSGFGAARLGGVGMGGGSVRPPEFFTYKRLLENHIKAGWRWPDSRAALQVQVEMSISPDGRLSNITVVGPSGNSEFDASVLRAVERSDPVPRPPAKVYESFFRVVRITFDPRSQ